MQEIRKASFGLVFVSGILLFLAFAMVAWLFFRFNTKADAYDAQRAQDRLKKLADYRKAESDKLNGVAWVDQAKGVARVPIEQAMRGLIADLKAKPVQASAVKVDNPYPYGLPQPKPSPAAGAAPSTTPAGTTSGPIPGQKDEPKGSETAPIVPKPTSTPADKSVENTPEAAQKAQPSFSPNSAATPVEATTPSPHTGPDANPSITPAQP